MISTKQERFRAFLEAKRGNAPPPSESPANRWLRREIDRAHGLTSAEDAEREELKAEIARVDEEIRLLREE